MNADKCTNVVDMESIESKRFQVETTHTHTRTATRSTLSGASFSTGSRQCLITTEKITEHDDEVENTKYEAI